jgi:hypothetical protein
MGTLYNLVGVVKIYIVSEISITMGLPIHRFYFARAIPAASGPGF